MSHTPLKILYKNGHLFAVKKKQMDEPSGTARDHCVNQHAQK